MNSQVSFEDLRQHSIDFQEFQSIKMNKLIETQGLTLKHHTELSLNNELKCLDNIFHLKNEILTENHKKPFESQPRINIKMKFKDINPPNLLEIVPEEPQIDSKTLAQKYLNIWKEETAKMKEKRGNKQNPTTNQLKEEQIDKFIQGLKAKRTEKLLQTKNSSNSKQSSRCSSSISNSNSTKNINLRQELNNSQKSTSEIYQNRYKAQRDIILMQKSKLLEQEQLIHELQYGKITEELKNSYDDSQNTIKNLLRKLSTKTKVVTGVKLVEEPEEVQMKINKVPKLVRCMEERAQERELKRQIIQERKRLIDEEKKRLLEEQLEKKRIQDEEEKKQALEAIKVRRRREVEEEKRRQAEKEKYLKKCKVADKFYKKLLKKRVISCFKIAVERQKYNENISIAFYETVLMKKSIFYWKMKTREIQSDKIEKATEHYEIKLKIKVFSVLKMVNFKAKQNMQVAIDYHAYQLQCKAFKEFYLNVNAIKIRRKHQMNIALRHYKTRLLVQTFYQWKSLPAIIQLERAKEEKKRKWREKILLIIPDYKPPELF